MWHLVLGSWGGFLACEGLWRAAILFFHGGREGRPCAPLDELADRVRALLRAEKVEFAFLEFAEPSAEMLVDRPLGRDSGFAGRQVSIVPVFFSGGGQFTGDLPGLVETVCEGFAGVCFETVGTSGEDLRVLSAMAGAVGRFAFLRRRSRAGSRS